jgi:hypothetical protein
MQKGTGMPTATEAAMTDSSSTSAAIRDEFTLRRVPNAPPGALPDQHGTRASHPAVASAQVYHAIVDDQHGLGRTRMVQRLETQPPRMEEQQG